MLHCWTVGSFFVLVLALRIWRTIVVTIARQFLQDTSVGSVAAMEAVVIGSVGKGADLFVVHDHRQRKRRVPRELASVIDRELVAKDIYWTRFRGRGGDERCGTSLGAGG